MQVTTNQKFVTSRRRIGRIATFAGFACLVVGLVITWFRSDLVFISYLTLLPGYVLISYGGYNTVRWGTKPRIDEAIALSLKNLDHRFQLFNYIDGLPADNILLTPTSVVVFELRPYMGEFSVSRDRNDRDRWRRKLTAMGIFMSITEGGLGNPSRDALRKVDETRRFLAKHLDEDAESIQVEAVVVFTHPRATLIVDNPEVPVVTARDLRSAIRVGDRQHRLPTQLLRRVTKLLKSPEAA